MHFNKASFYLYFNNLYLLIIVFIIIHYYLINLKEISENKSVFSSEEMIFLYDKIIYKNFSKVYYKKDINKLRKKSKYRKKGYGGHPIYHTFSYPLDKSIILYPQKNISFFELVIFIHCRPEEFYERFVYRKCYNKSNNFRVLYITSKSRSNDINRKLRSEAKEYKDILQFNELSSYFNLSIQTVHMITWSVNLKYKYLLKSDIDVYINIPNIIKWLKNYNSTTRYYAIGKISKTHVLRNKKYSHYVPKDVIKEDMYPPYLQGVGYILPYHTIELLIETIEYINPKIWIEDVFIGYMLKYNNVTLINISNYILRDIPNNFSFVLHNINKYMMIHELYPFELYLLTKYSNYYS